MCCDPATGACNNTMWPQHQLAMWTSNNAVSLLSLPGASATLIIENVVLRGSPGSSDWLNSGRKNGGQGAALNINQQGKFFKGMTNPLGELGYDEGALCTPQVRMGGNNEGALCTPYP